MSCRAMAFASFPLTAPKLKSLPAAGGISETPPFATFVYRLFAKFRFNELLAVSGRRYGALLREISSVPSSGDVSGADTRIFVFRRDIRGKRQGRQETGSRCRVCLLRGFSN